MLAPNIFPFPSQGKAGMGSTMPECQCKSGANLLSAEKESLLRVVTEVLCMTICLSLQVVNFVFELFLGRSG